MAKKSNGFQYLVPKTPTKGDLSMFNGMLPANPIKYCKMCGRVIEEGDFEAYRIGLCVSKKDDEFGNGCADKAAHMASEKEAEMWNDGQDFSKPEDPKDLRR